jgi:guanosine-3',5'-bis(diphosphate) 3'-pyrophosphohydrolase
MSDSHSYDEIIEENSPETVEELVLRLKDNYTAEEIELIKLAYDFSEKAHEGQIRRSGEPYIAHPLSVAAILSDLKLDYATVATGLLHDTVEDTDVTLKDITEKFGENVAHLVDGVTKITQMKFRNTHEKQGENIRKMIVAMGKDVRVVLVKLADRLHNMRTLTHMPFKKQSRIATETLDIYAPLASRLGINSMKVELEDLSFRYAYPDMYYELAQKVARKKKEREKYIEDVQRQLAKEIKLKSKAHFEISGRPKHLYSIYKKMQMRSIDYEQVYDVLAFRVCVGSIPECYEILGLVHAMWKPIPGRFKDFIAMPKANNYQSLHTTVIGPQAERIEIQIRTTEMHIIAERGIAAHWNYKEQARGENGEGSGLEKYNWLRELISLHKQADTSDEFLETIKSDLFESEIYVFTPKGEVKEFPEGASPIDFAYSVHTDVGNSVVAARVNGKLVPLKYKLQNGDRGHYF